MAWTIKRAAISAFVTAHLAAVVLWNLPECALKERLGGWTAYYIMPTGMWQEWGMFAPDPGRETLALEAVVHTRPGIMKSYSFPRMADRTVWQGFWGFRHSKLATNLSHKNAVAEREFSARHVIRILGLPADDFPVEVELFYRVWPSPPFAEPVADPPASSWVSAIQTYRFESLAEAQP